MVSVRQLRKLFRAYWRPLALYGGLVLAFAALLWFRLGTLTGGYSSDELNMLQNSLSVRYIIEHPLNAPFLLVGRALLLAGEQSAFWLRLAATLFGLLTLTVFYWLLRYWHGERCAVIGTILFGTSAWFLHAARLGTPGVLLFGLLGLIACALWLRRTQNPLVLCITLAVVAGLLYVPGMVWLIAVGVIWQAKTIYRLMRQQVILMSIGAVGLLALLTPLVMAIYRSPELAKIMVGLPGAGWPDILECVKRLGMVPVNLFVRGPLDPQMWLARLPILDAFCAAMLLLGAYLYARHFRLVRTQLIVAAIAIGAVLISLGGVVNLSIIVPFVYVLIAAGIGFLLDRWYQVFPRNVIAQSVGIGLIGLAVTASCWYGIRQYFVAWPAVPATKQIFVIPQAQPVSDTIKK